VSGEIKSQPIALLLTLLFPGAGHLYLGLTKKATPYLVANSIGLILTVISLGFGLIIAFPIWLVTLLMLVGSLGPDTERVNEALREGRPIREP